jgi:hypothetical protein
VWSCTTALKLDESLGIFYPWHNVQAEGSFSFSGFSILPPRMEAGWKLRAFGLLLGTMRAPDEEEGTRQDDYEACHNPNSASRF